MQGKAARDIAGTLCISYATVCDHLPQTILRKLGVHSQREAVRLDLEQHLVGVHTLSQWWCLFSQRIKFGCTFNILPMGHSLGLAEDLAMLDTLTGGCHPSSFPAAQAQGRP